MRDLSVRAANRDWIQPKRDKCVAVNNPGMKGGSKEPDLKSHLIPLTWDMEFGAYPAGFWYCFGP